MNVVKNNVRIQIQDWYWAPNNDHFEMRWKNINTVQYNKQISSDIESGAGDKFTYLISKGKNSIFVQFTKYAGRTRMYIRLMHALLLKDWDRRIFSD